MTTTVTAKIQLRKGTAASWTSANPVLLSGEVGFETDTHKFKIGDGTTAWISLAYHHDPDLAATYAAIAHTHSGVYEPANANLQAHISSTANPHSVTAAQAGADATGTAAGLLTSHEAAANPHPGYLTPAEGDAAYATVGHAHSGVYDPAGTASSAVSAHAGGSGVHAIASVTGLQTALDGKSATSHDHAATYAPLAQGVTNGDFHDHSGGDGAQIAYSGLSGLPTLGTAAAQNTGAFEASGAISTHAAVTSSVHGISSFGATLVDDADAATARSTLGLASGATTAAYAGAASEIHAATDKATPVDADELGLVDSAASFVLKKLTWANLKTTLSSVFALLAGKSGGQTLIGGTGVTDKLVLQGTSGDGTSTATALAVKVGNNGATNALTVLNNGKVGIGSVTYPSAQLEIAGISGVNGLKITGSGSYTGTYSLINEYGNFSNILKSETYLAGYTAQLAGDSAGRIAIGLDFGTPFMAWGPGNGGRDVFLKRSNGDLIFLYGTTPSTKVIMTAAGRIGAGVSSASAQLHAVSTTEQLRLAYDASYYASCTVSSAGNLTLTNTGTTIYTDKVIENTVSGAGIVLKSPDGTRYRLTVANGGTLSIAAA